MIYFSNNWFRFMGLQCLCLAFFADPPFNTAVLLVSLFCACAPIVLKKLGEGS